MSMMGYGMARGLSYSAVIAGIGGTLVAAGLAAAWIYTQGQGSVVQKIENATLQREMVVLDANMRVNGPTIIEDATLHKDLKELKEKWTVTLDPNEDHVKLRFGRKMDLTADVDWSLPSLLGPPPPPLPRAHPRL